MDFSQFAVTKTAASKTSIKDLSVEEAREVVKVIDGNTKKPVEGFQGLTLRLSRLKLSLDAVAPKAVKLQVPEAQVEEVTAGLLAAVAEGIFDDAIEAALITLNTVNAPVAAAVPSDADLEEFEEEEEDA